MNKKDILKEFMKDGEIFECKEITTNNVKKSTRYCPNCGSKKTYCLDCDEQPEWTYICTNCKVRFIAVMEDFKK